jgi:hypothetical protein
MNNSCVSIRYLLTVAILFAGVVSVLADNPVSGKVSGVKQNNHSFSVHYWITVPSHRGGERKEGHEQTFQTTNETKYLVGSSKGSWLNVTKGATVKVTSHGGVADTVQITPGS